MADQRSSPRVGGVPAGYPGNPPARTTVATPAQTAPGLSSPSAAGAAFSRSVYPTRPPAAPAASPSLRYSIQPALASPPVPRISLHPPREIPAPGPQSTKNEMLYARGETPSIVPGVGRQSMPPASLPGLAAAPVPRITVAPGAPAGWSGKATEFPPYYADSRLVKLSDALVEIFEDLGVENAFGLIGGSVAPFAEALSQGRMNIIYCRHEAGAVFAAIEASFVTHKPNLVFATTGPGITNALTGLMAARRDGARVIMVSGCTAAPQRGRWAFQESSAFTMPISGIYTPGPLFHFAVMVEQAAELPEIARRLALGLEQPGGFVAHIAVPISVQNTRAMAPSNVRNISLLTPGYSMEAALDYAQALTQDSFAIWLGFGARYASAPIRELAERTGAPVFCSPRAKGIFPENHPQFVGVTGFGGHESVIRYMNEERPAYILVLGTRLGEFTSFWDQTLVPSKAFVHVDLDPEVPGVAYPGAHTFGIQAEIGAFVESLLAHIPAGAARHQTRPIPRHVPPVPLSPRAERLVRPGFLMEAIQRVIVENSDAVVMTEAGNAFAWGGHALRFDEPCRYRVSTGFGSMGHAVAGVIGAALARNGKAVAICGDGAMLMNSEISTAVQHKLPAVWIVLNDAQYGMIDHGMRALGMDPVETQIPICDFVMIARGMGADGIRVERESEVSEALAIAMNAEGPFVVDVLVDPRSVAPFHRRNQSLNQQGAMATLGKT